MAWADSHVILDLAGRRPRAAPSGPPARVTVPTCAGCGAMRSPGLCETGCAEHRLLLAAATTVDALTNAQSEILSSIAMLRPALDELANTAPRPEGWEAAYGALRVRARAALSHPVDARTAAYVLDEPAEPVLAWWCDRCDGVDAPQPCLGVCVWRPIDWTRYEIYAALRERVVSLYETEQRLRALVRRIAHTSPRPGQHFRTWLAYAEALEPGDGRCRRTRLRQSSSEPHTIGAKQSSTRMSSSGSARV